MTASPLRDTAGGGGAEKGATEREMEKGTDGERREGGVGGSSLLAHCGFRTCIGFSGIPRLTLKYNLFINRLNMLA